MSLATVMTLRPSAGRRARRRLELRTRILRAALDLFARHGFFATSVEEITEAADVGKGTFFNYFPTKEHVLAGFGELQLSKVRAAVDEARGGRKPLRRTLQRLLESLAVEPARSPALVRGLLSANLSSEAVRQLMRRNLARGRRLLARLIAEAQRRGEIRRDRKASELAWHFQRVYFGTLLLWSLHPPTPLNQRLRETFESFWAGISGGSGLKREQGEGLR